MYSPSPLLPAPTLVDNSIKYDVSRAFLEDLNVTEKVWIGLKKAESSERFVWS